MPPAILVLGGKGGIGKTLIAYNIALRLVYRGFNVGIIDADISSPNLVPEFIRLKEKRLKVSTEKIEPFKLGKLSIFSMSMIVGEEAGVAMTGDQYSQLLRDAVLSPEWNCEYIVVDMPAGMGDEMLKLIEVFGEQLIGSVIIVQPAHTLDVRRVIEFHLDNEIPIVGLIENMSKMKCIVCGTEYPIFGESVVDKLADEYKLKSFGSIPLSMEIRNKVKDGKPFLRGELGKPIKSCVDEIVKMKPKKPGFMEKVSEKVKDVIHRVIIDLLIAIKKYIPVSEIQFRTGMKGGSVVHLKIMDENMKDLVKEIYLKLVEGTLYGVEEPKKIDYIIEVTPRAFARSILGYKLPSGRTYDFSTAWRHGKLRFWGDIGASAKGIYFMQELINEIRKREEVISMVKPLLLRLM